MPAASHAPSYVEFEPFCQWHRQENRDVLELHLPEFKREKLSVQVTNRATLHVSGRHSIDPLKQRKFYKEVEVPKYCDANSIHTKFSKGCLHVIMPKKPKVPTEQSKEIADTTKDKMQLLSMMKNCRKISLKVAVAVAVLTALSSYVFYMCRS